MRSNSLQQNQEFFLLIQSLFGIISRHFPFIALNALNVFSFESDFIRWISTYKVLPSFLLLQSQKKKKNIGKNWVGNTRHLFYGTKEAFTADSQSRDYILYCCLICQSVSSHCDEYICLNIFIITLKPTPRYWEKWTTTYSSFAVPKLRPCRWLLGWWWGFWPVANLAVRHQAFPAEHDHYNKMRPCFHINCH